MSRFVFVLLAVLAAFSASSNGEECPVNQEYNVCGTACEPTCSQPDPYACTYNCIIGCQCKPGFVRNSVGACVTLQEC
ncbi:chymotrypsin inhibitor [Megalopta genalis]|uniref:chymotrypsin inhibitor n=1 Tax=Megalopta genalis TaxID=115081 RepID=UPI0014437749|nr:chymotrypsin inhibitor-like [Megalopta genalis]